jgi:hypothetical protein
MQQQQTENVARAGDAETQLPSNVLDQVGMSNELMNRVEKEIK